MNSSEWNTLLLACGSLMTFATSLWGLGVWMNKRFDGMKDFVEIKIEKILDKLEYHERHDDSRFTNVNEALWKLRLDSVKNRGNVFDQKNKERNDLCRQNGEASSS